MLKVSVVSYLNSIPFIYGLQHGGFSGEFVSDVPADCAEKLLNGTVDVGLVPVAVLKDKPQLKIISDYCIGASGKVKSVLLLSKKPFQNIKTIYLDSESRTSAALAKILATNFWQIDVQWKPLTDKDWQTLQDDEAVVAIGNKTFEMVKHFECVYDLAEQWRLFTGLPFVFACWVSNRDLLPDDLENFTQAMDFGLQHKLEAVKAFSPNPFLSEQELEAYITHDIDFHLDEAKRKAMRLFLQYI